MVWINIFSFCNFYHYVVLCVSESRPKEDADYDDCVPWRQKCKVIHGKSLGITGLSTKQSFWHSKTVLGSEERRNQAKISKFPKDNILDIRQFNRLLECFPTPKIITIVLLNIYVILLSGRGRKKGSWEKGERSWPWQGSW